MATPFQLPEFKDGQVEIRIDSDGVAIYGTCAGLTELARICTMLASRSLGRAGTAHIHLEDHGLLTGESLNTTVAVLERPL
jgi:hypothetical protein